MSNLKPCPFCGGEAFRIDGGEFVTCSRSRKGCFVDEVFYDYEWNTRAMPELPDGYRKEGDALFYRGTLIAEVFPGGSLVIHEESLDEIDALALTIWLQRRAGE